MYKITVKFRNNEVHRTPDKVFYAEFSYDTIGDGRMVYWTEHETEDIISIPTALIAEIIEKEVEARHVTR